MGLVSHEHRPLDAHVTEEIVMERTTRSVMYAPIQILIVMTILAPDRVRAQTPPPYMYENQISSGVPFEDAMASIRAQDALRPKAQTPRTQDTGTDALDRQPTPSGNLRPQLTNPPARTP